VQGKLGWMDPVLDEVKDHLLEVSRSGMLDDKDCRDKIVPGRKRCGHRMADGWEPSTMDIRKCLMHDQPLFVLVGC
jgi:hypothetical protein